MLTDAIWAKGRIKKGVSKVNLWLGANIMVEYSFKEAIALLNNNLENAVSNLRIFVIYYYFVVVDNDSCNVIGRGLIIFKRSNYYC